jgi:hypothetical protein
VWKILYVVGNNYINEFGKDSEGNNLKLINLFLKVKMWSEKK